MRDVLAKRVTDLFNQGLSDQAIAERMGKSVYTIVLYRSQLKLHRRELVLVSKRMLHGRIDKMLKEDRGVLTVKITKALGCSVYEVNKRRKALGIESPLRREKEKKEAPAKVERPKESVFVASHTYYNYADAVKKNLEFLNKLDFGHLSYEEFKKYLGEEEGLKYLDWRYPQLPKLVGSPEYEA